MRLLIWHVDSFLAEPTRRGRSPVADIQPLTIRVDEALVVFAQCEKADEASPDAVAARAVEAVNRVAVQLKVNAVVLHSFAHLFGEPSDPAIARQILAATQERLRAGGLDAHQTAFGWFNRLEMNAKGHPYSRQARQV